MTIITVSDTQIFVQKARRVLLRIFVKCASSSLCLRCYCLFLPLLQCGLLMIVLCPKGSLAQSVIIIQILLMCGVTAIVIWLIYNKKYYTQLLLWRDSLHQDVSSNINICHKRWPPPLKACRSIHFISNSIMRQQISTFYAIWTSSHNN